MTTLTYAERITAWRQGNPDKRLTFELLLEIFDATDLRGADLRGADLRHANLWNADLRSANLWNANLRHANLRHANLRHANLWNADLRSANLWNANLRNANLSNADLWSANLSNADWNGLQVNGLPSGQANLAPTPSGWMLSVGCWTGTIDGLRTLIAQDDDWPEAEGEEITRRRPGLQAALALIEAHIALYPTLIDELKERWATK